jgi:hypothetical protein
MANSNRVTTVSTMVFAKEHGELTSTTSAFVELVIPLGQFHSGHTGITDSDLLGDAEVRQRGAL